MAQRIRIDLLPKGKAKVTKSTLVLVANILSNEIQEQGISNADFVNQVAKKLQAYHGLGKVHLGVNTKDGPVLEIFSIEESELGGIVRHKNPAIDGLPMAQGLPEVIALLIKPLIPNLSEE